jgi:hypothetical protein
MRLSADLRRSKRVTQSISLSNIQTFSHRDKASPEAVETYRTKGSSPACFLIGATEMTAIGKQRMDLVELTGIEPVTPCLQSRCSPS